MKPPLSDTLVICDMDNTLLTAKEGIPACNRAVIQLYTGMGGLFTVATGRPPESIREALGDKMVIGAGTVMSVEEVRAAKEAGASFALAPNVDETVIKETVACGLESIPGAMTPSEIADAYRCGASVVKLFPAGNLGLSYCKAVMAPINNVPMIAVGGVDDKNLPDFLKAGFIGLGIGSSLTNKKMIEEGRYDELKALAEVYVKAAEN